jgi:hypothetical protein
LKHVFQVDALRTASGREVRGYHVLISTDWGIAELQVRHASDEVAQFAAEVLDQMELGTPLERPSPDVATTAHARDLFGTWKAERARLIVRADGAIDLQHDKERVRQLDQIHLRRPQRRLRGTYIADGDVLYVTWADGSQLNLRWSSTYGQLLLTDHFGRVSQLHRLFE